MTGRRRPREGGQAILEMGLSMTLLFFLIFGIVEYSRINYANNFCAYAAQQAARYASVRGAGTVNQLPTSPSPCGQSCTNVSSGDPTAAYVQSLAVALDTSKFTVTTSWSASTGNGNAAGGTVTVRVQYAYTPLLTVVTASLGSPFTMTASSTMVVIG